MGPPVAENRQMGQLKRCVSRLHLGPEFPTEAIAGGKADITRRSKRPTTDDRPRLSGLKKAPLVGEVRE